VMLRALGTRYAHADFMGYANVAASVLGAACKLHCAVKVVLLCFHRAARQ